MLSSVPDREEDKRTQLKFATNRGHLYTEMQKQKLDIEALISSHCELAGLQVHIPPKLGPYLGMKASTCVYLWIDNAGLSLPAKIASRLPLPCKVGEEGFVPRKCGGEAAFRSSNLHLPIPRPRSFGLPDGLSVGECNFWTVCQLAGTNNDQFYHPICLQLWQRIKFYVERFVRRLTGRSFCDYIPQKSQRFWTWATICLTGSTAKLSDLFTNPHTKTQTQNSYRGMLKIMISLSRILQHRTGSWTIDNAGCISLSN